MFQDAGPVYGLGEADQTIVRGLQQLKLRHREDPVCVCVCVCVRERERERACIHACMRNA